MNDASVALAARVVLAVVLVVSATAKLRARVEVERSMGHHVGVRLAPLIGPVLPGFELAIAAALVAWWSPVPGVVALVMLAAFTIVLVRAQARHIPCLCFGAANVSVSAGPAGVVRNGVLAALAVFAIGDPAGAHLVAAVLAAVVFGAIAAAAVRASGTGRVR
jgi:hypothetical protein